MNRELKTSGSHKSLQTAESSEQCGWLARDRFRLHLLSLSVKQQGCFLVELGRGWRWSCDYISSLKT